VDPVGGNIRMARRRKGLTQGELARLAEMHSVPLSDIERGKHLPSLPVLRRLASALGTTCGALLGEDRRATCGSPVLPVELVVYLDGVSEVWRKWRKRSGPH